MLAQRLKCFIILSIFGSISIVQCKKMLYKQKPAPDGHRCGICPTYFQKVCAFDLASKSTYVFDNHCIMDLHNCLEKTNFVPMTYDKCLYFGNFAYVHGLNKEAEDYDDRHYYIEHSKKNPDFI